MMRFDLGSIALQMGYSRIPAQSGMDRDKSRKLSHVDPPQAAGGCTAVNMQSADTCLVEGWTGICFEAHLEDRSFHSSRF